MKRNVITATVATATLLVGVGIGATGAHANNSKPETRYELLQQARREIFNATHYADWCGGFVQIENGKDVVVEGCDK